MYIGEWHSSEAAVKRLNPLSCATPADARPLQVYLGKWHSSEVAVKCLNPSMFFSAHGDLNSNVAILDLLREADLLGSLRHPNVVWVYGIVLPRLVRARTQGSGSCDLGYLGVRHHAAAPGAPADSARCSF